MNKRFTPSNYLNPREIVELKKVKLGIKKAQSQAELEYYESILDMLMESAIEKFNKEQEKNKELQVN